MAVYKFSLISLTEALKEKIGQDVLLFSLDSMSYYGLLQDVGADNIATLRPAALSSTGLVEIQNPAEVAAVLNTVSIDLCGVIAFGYNITADPFVMPDDNAEDVPPADEEAEEPKPALPCRQRLYPCETDALIEKLLDTQQIITVSTFGGFLFAGRIKALKNKLLRLKAEYVFAPGGDGSTLFSVEDIAINLDAATAVGS